MSFFRNNNDGVNCVVYYLLSMLLVLLSEGLL